MSPGQTRNFSRLVSLLLLTAAGQHARGQDGLTVSCASSRGTNAEDVCVEAVVTDGAITIRAGTLTRRNPDRGEWSATGGVVITTEEAELTADSLVAVRDEGEYQLFRLDGSPSRISVTRKGDETTVRAEAERVIYDLENSLLTLSGDVSFQIGESAWNTCELSYNLDDGSYNADTCETRATIPLANRETAGDPDPSVPPRDGP